MKKVAICIATYKRPNKLKKLLESLTVLNVDSKKISLQFIIVDNDINKSARKIVDSYSNTLPIYYVVQETPGISYVRNKCLDIAIGYYVDYIAFLDDDEEVVSAKWLMRLLETQERYKADVVCGPVVTIYDENTPEWIIESKFYDRSRISTGTKLDYCGAGNVLISIDVFDELQKPFFPYDFNFSGGEDTFFFMNLSNLGKKIVWCDEAVVIEKLVSNRMTLNYMLKRSFNSSNVFSICEKMVYRKFNIRLSRFLKSMFKICLGSLRCVFTSLLGKKHRIKSLLLLSQGLGGLIGLLNIKSNLYRDHK